MKYGLQGHRSQQLCSKGKNVLSLLHYYNLLKCSGLMIGTGLVYWKLTILIESLLPPHRSWESSCIMILPKVVLTKTKDGGIFNHCGTAEDRIDNINGIIYGKRKRKLHLHLVLGFAMVWMKLNQKLYNLDCSQCSWSIPWVNISTILYNTLGRG